jgi:hypothetical protein
MTTSERQPQQPRQAPRAPADERPDATDEPADESAIESLGRAVAEPVIGAERPPPDRPEPRRDDGERGAS